MKRCHRKGFNVLHLTEKCYINYLTPDLARCPEERLLVHWFQAIHQNRQNPCYNSVLGSRSRCVRAVILTESCKGGTAPIDRHSDTIDSDSH
jgi:hypothetical protein